MIFWNAVNEKHASEHNGNEWTHLAGRRAVVVLAGVVVGVDWRINAGLFGLWNSETAGVKHDSSIVF